MGKYGGFGTASDYRDYLLRMRSIGLSYWNGPMNSGGKHVAFHFRQCAQPWREGAAEIRALVADLDDERAKQKMLRIADDYERYAKRAEDRKNSPTAA